MELSDLPFAETLTELMKEKGLTFRGLSELSGLDHSYLYRLARGIYRASDKAINKVVQALGVEPSYFREWRMRNDEIRSVGNSVVDSLVSPVFPSDSGYTHSRIFNAAQSFKGKSQEGT